jgi:hypothetical protein
MQVWHLVAQAGEIQLVRLQDLNQRLLEREYHAHDLISAGSVKLRHLFYVSVPDHSTQAWIVGLVGPYSATVVVFPQDLAAGSFTEHASHVLLLRIHPL